MKTHIEYDDFGAYEETLEDLMVYDGSYDGNAEETEGSVTI